MDSGCLDLPVSALSTSYSLLSCFPVEVVVVSQFRAFETGASGWGFHSQATKHEHVFVAELII